MAVGSIRPWRGSSSRAGRPSTARPRPGRGARAGRGLGRHDRRDRGLGAARRRRRRRRRGSRSSTGSGGWTRGSRSTTRPDRSPGSAARSRSARRVWDRASRRSWIAEERVGPVGGARGRTRRDLPRRRRSSRRTPRRPRRTRDPAALGQDAAHEDADAPRAHVATALARGRVRRRRRAAERAGPAAGRWATSRATAWPTCRPSATPWSPRSRPGQRTPLFTIAEYAPVLLVRAAGATIPGGHAWSGVVRCEAAGSSCRSPRSSSIADRTAARAPARRVRAPSSIPARRRTSSPSPALERQLRHRMGDRGLVYRALREAVHERMAS